MSNRDCCSDVSIIRLDDGLNFKIRCRQQNPPSDNASIERSFRALSSGGKTDRDSWCDSIERICAENRSHRSSMGSTDMIIDQQNPDQSVESTDIDMPMVPELQQASRRLTMDSFARIKGLEQNSNLDERVAMLIGYFSSWTRLLWSRISRLSQKRFHSSSNGNESERGAHFSKSFTSDFSRTEFYFFETMLTPK